MTEQAGYEAIPNAIILQAHEDYVNALVTENKAMRMLFEAAKAKADVLSFYGGEWYYHLTTLDPQVLIDTARKQADYIIWQKQKGCAGCKFTPSQCPHRVARENWKEWINGKNKCLKTLGKSTKEAKDE